MKNTMSSIILFILQLIYFSQKISSKLQTYCKVSMWVHENYFYGKLIEKKLLQSLESCFHTPEQTVYSIGVTWRLQSCIQTVLKHVDKLANQGKAYQHEWLINNHHSNRFHNWTTSDDVTRIFIQHSLSHKIHWKGCIIPFLPINCLKFTRNFLHKIYIFRISS